MLSSRNRAGYPHQFPHGKWCNLIACGLQYNCIATCIVCVEASAERGSNRISASRLVEFAKVLDVPIPYFFDEMPANALSASTASSRAGKNAREASTPFEQDKDPLVKRETLELVRAYYKIRESGVRKKIFQTVKALGAASHAEVLASKPRAVATRPSAIVSHRKTSAPRRPKKPGRAA
jgi:hypothetical protein